MLKAYYFDNYEVRPCLILKYNFRTGRFTIVKYITGEKVVTRECKIDNLAILKGWNKNGLPENF